MKTFFSCTNLHKHYGPTVIFDGASVAIDEGQKIGVIGRNGAGKSTLCKMFLGEEEIDAGRISLHEDLRLSYLQQQDPFHDGETVLEFLMRSSGKEEWQCGMIAGKFLLKHDLLERPVRSLSGGYQTRVKLVSMMLADPNFLILDEPTNYLDLRTLMLLERFLKEFDGGFLIVSHDREFLMKTCTATMEVERGAITLYPGNVEAWLAYKAEQVKQAEHHNANVALRRKELQTFVDKNRAKASKASQAQSKLKMLNRLQTIDIGNPLASVTITIPPVEDRKGMVLRTQGLSIGYPGKTVAQGIDLEIDRGNHVAILGDNGQGKTTFLNCIAGKLEAMAGAFKWGHEVRIGYYAQHVYASLNANMTVLQHLEKCADGNVKTQPILDMAGSFLFRGDDVQKKISVLSGGERSRLVLAGLLLGKFPVLILDEPTNHLDFETVEALAGALSGFNGTIFFTCHDRTFVNTLATNIVEVKDGKVALYPDDYQSYVWRLEQEVDEAEDDKPKPADKPRANPQEAKEIERLLKTAEKKIKELEKEKSQLVERFSGPGYSPKDEHRFDQVSKQLETCEAEWLSLQERSEDLKGR
jgi:ATP-binding cassette subfamily F protein 3